MSAPDDIRFPCPHCPKQLRAPAGLAGRRVGCPKCGKTVEVPAPLPPDDGDHEPPRRGPAAAPPAPPSARPARGRSQIPVLLGCGAFAAAVLAGGAALGFYLSKKAGGETVATVTGQTLSYRPAFPEPTLGPDERLAVFILVTPAGGQKLTEEVCRAGGDMMMSYGGQSFFRVDGNMHGPGGFLGYRIVAYPDDDAVLKRAGISVHLEPKGTGFGSSGSLGRLGKAAQVSVAVGVYRKKDNYDFDRLVTPVSVVEFTP